MKLQQLSVFLENAPGRLHEVTQALGEAGVHLRALSLVDTGNLGVLRFIPSDAVAARRVMMEKQLPAQVDEVVAAEVDDEPESLDRVLQPLAAERVNVEYMYACTGLPSGKALMVFHFRDNDRAVEILERSRIRVLTSEAFASSERPGREARAS